MRPYKEVLLHIATSKILKISSRDPGQIVFGLYMKKT